MKGLLRETLVTILIAVLVFALLQATVQNFKVEGGSMKPNIQDGQYILVDKSVYHFHPPQQGEIIVFHAPRNPDRDFIKRVIGLPGDIVEVKKGKVYVNGDLLSEPYIEEPPTYTCYEEVSPEHYFVLGDNRNNSNDSHSGWLVPRESIIGKAWLCLWPPSSWGLAPNYNLDVEIPEDAAVISPSTAYLKNEAVTALK